MNTKLPHSLENVFTGRPNGSLAPSVQQDVLQDKHAPKRVRIASVQPVTLESSARTRRMERKTPRTQNHSTKRQTVQVAAWVRKPIRAELERLAAQNGLSLSQTIAALLEEGIRQQWHSQHAVLLQPIIKDAIRQEMRADSNRLALLLVRDLFADEQTRSLVTNILGRQPGVTQPVLEQILNSSSMAAKRKITHVTPQLKHLVEEVAQWLEKEEGEQPHA
jgi:hypothetical protein